MFNLITVCLDFWTVLKINLKLTCINIEHLNRTVCMKNNNEKVEISTALYQEEMAP